MGRIKTDFRSRRRRHLSGLWVDRSLAQELTKVVISGRDLQRNRLVDERNCWQASFSGLLGNVSFDNARTSVF